MKRPVFLLAVHADPVQFRRLVTLLSTVGRCIVHVDQKADATRFQVELPNVTFIRPTIDVRWAGVSQVRATLALIREGLLIGAEAVSHYVLLSGSCYPARSLTDLCKFLHDSSDRDFLAHSEIRPGISEFECLTRWWFYEDLPVGRSRFGVTRLTRGALQAALKCARRRPPFFANWYFGSNWWVLRPVVLRHVDEACTEELLSFCRFSMASDEMIFHTLVANSQYHDFGQQTVADHVSQLTNLHLVDRSLTKWFTESDLYEVTASKRWFVRKVSSAASSSLCDRLDEVSGNIQLLHS